MTHKARVNYIKAIGQQINRKKMYKAKKNWVVAGMSFLVLAGLSAVGVNTHADTTTDNVNNKTTQPLNSNSQSNGSNDRVTDLASNLHDKIMNDNTYTLGRVHTPSFASENSVQSSSNNAVSTKAQSASSAPVQRQSVQSNDIQAQKQSTKQSNNVQAQQNSGTPKSVSVVSTQSASAQSNAPSNNVTRSSIRNNRVDVQVNNNIKQTSANIKNNQVKQPFTKAKSITDNVRNGYLNNYINRPLMKVGLEHNIGDSNNAQSKASDNHWIYDNGKFISSMPSTDTISDGTYDGLTYEYDKTLQALDFTGGKINVSDTSNFLNVSQFGSGYNLMSGSDSNDILKSVKFNSDVDISNVTDMSDMFVYNTALKFISFGDSFNPQRVSDINNMFSGDTSLKSLNLGNNFDTHNIKFMSNMFSNDSSLQSVSLGNKFNTINAEKNSSTAMFSGCNNLKVLVIQSPNTVFNFHEMSDNPDGLPTMYKETGSDDSSGRPYTLSVPNDFSLGNVGTFTVNKNPKTVTDTILYINSDNTNDIIGSGTKLSGASGSTTHINWSINMPKYWHISSDTSLNMDINSDPTTDPQFKYDGGIHYVYLIPNHISDTIQYQYNSNTLDTQRFGGNDANAQGASDTNFTIGSNPTGLPNGYHVINPNQFIRYDGNTHQVAVALNKVNQTINYVWHGQNKGTTVMNGTYNTNGSANSNGLDAGWHINDDGSQSFTFNNGTQNVDITPNIVTDTVNYQYDGNTIASHQFNGNDYRTGVNGTLVVSNLTTGMPDGYHVNNNQSINYDNSTHNIAIIPDTVTDTIKFNGDSGADYSIQGGYHTTGYVEAPSGYHFTNGATQNSFTYNGGTHSYDVALNQLPIHINYIDNGRVIKSTSPEGTPNTPYKLEAEPLLKTNYRLVNPNHKPLLFDGSTQDVQVVNIPLAIANADSADVSKDQQNVNDLAYTPSDTASINDAKAGINAAIGAEANDDNFLKEVNSDTNAGQVTSYLDNSIEEADQANALYSGAANASASGKAQSLANSLNTQINNDIGSVNGRMNKDEIGLNSANTNANAALASLKTEDARISANSNNAVNYSNALVSLNGRANKDENNIKNDEADIKKNTGNISTLTNDDSKLTQDASNLSGDVTSLSSEATSISSNSQSLANSLSSQDINTVTSVNNRISHDETNFNTNINKAVTLANSTAGNNNTVVQSLSKSEDNRFNAISSNANKAYSSLSTLVSTTNSNNMSQFNSEITTTTNSLSNNISSLSTIDSSEALSYSNSLSLSIDSTSTAINSALNSANSYASNLNLNTSSWTNNAINSASAKASSSVSSADRSINASLSSVSNSASLSASSAYSNAQSYANSEENDDISARKAIVNTMNHNINSVSASASVSVSSALSSATQYASNSISSLRISASSKASSYASSLSENISSLSINVSYNNSSTNQAVVNAEYLSHLEANYAQDAAQSYANSGLNSLSNHDDSMTKSYARSLSDGIDSESQALNSGLNHDRSYASSMASEVSLSASTAISSASSSASSAIKAGNSSANSGFVSTRASIIAVSSKADSELSSAVSVGTKYVSNSISSLRTSASSKASSYASSLSANMTGMNSKTTNVINHLSSSTNQGINTDAYLASAEANHAQNNAENYTNGQVNSLSSSTNSTINYNTANLTSGIESNADDIRMNSNQISDLTPHKRTAIITNIHQLKTGHTAYLHGVKLTKLHARRHLHWIKFLRHTRLYTDLLHVGKDRDYSGTVSPHNRFTLRLKGIYLVHGRHHNALRFEVRLGHMNYFITANHKFVRNAYLQRHNLRHVHKHHGHFYIRTIHHVYEYRGKHNYENYIKCFKPHHKLAVKKIVHIGRKGYEQTRLELTNHHYITANLNYIKLI